MTDLIITFPIWLLTGMTLFTIGLFAWVLRQASKRKPHKHWKPDESQEWVTDF